MISIARDSRATSATFSWLLALTLMAAGAGAQRATELPQPIFSTSAPRIENVVEELMYFYRHMRYEPAVVVAPVAKAGASYDSPEAAVIARISAMIAGDVAWWRDTWTADARQMMEARDRQLGRGADHWPARWHEVLEGARVELTDRIETGQYVLIAYRVVPPGGQTADAPPLVSIAVLEQVGGRWLGTQALAEDPVLHYWNRPGFRVKKMVREIDVN